MAETCDRRAHAPSLFARASAAIAALTLGAYVMADIEQTATSRELAVAAVTVFLRREDATITGADVERLIGSPTTRMHPDLGAVDDFRGELGNFWISTRGNVVFFSGSSLRPSDRETDGNGGLLLAHSFAARHVADFESRNFTERQVCEPHSVTVIWSEQPRTGIETAVFPNWVEVVVQLPSGRVSRFSSSDLRLTRATAPQISETEARALIKGKFDRAAIEDIDLIILPGRSEGTFLTVWNASVMTASPEGPIVRNVVLDADTGELIEQ